MTSPAQSSWANVNDWNFSSNRRMPARNELRGFSTSCSKGKSTDTMGLTPNLGGVLVFPWSSGDVKIIWRNHVLYVREQRWFVGWVDPTVPLIQWKPWAWHSCRLIQVLSEDVPPKKTSKFSTSSLLKFWAPGTSISTSRYIKSDLSEVQSILYISI